MTRINPGKAAIGAAALIFLTSAASAQDRIRVAAAQRGVWDSAIAELGEQAGIFKKHDLLLELTYTSSNAQTLQGVISGTVDIGVDVVAPDVMRSYSRGAPVRIIGANTTGDPQYWYVLASSPIRTVNELVGRTIGYAANGSSSQYNAFDLMKQYRFKTKLMPTGGAVATLEQVVAQRVDVGWAVPPFGIDEIESGKIRLVARANDVQGVRDKTVSVLITNTETLEKRKSAISRFMDGYRETIEWMYSDSAALKRFAELAGVSENVAQRLRDGFFTKDMLTPDQIVGLKAIMKDAIQSRHIQTSLSRRQRAELIQISARGSAHCWFFRAGCSPGGAAASP